ncbi:hypothetical protein T265_09007 [Opisthorchis viverrini]|uniref:Uncharacterized protein n=1 Tax=Opisthorchis viverrini TaxID=6198 RepID=A0A074Z7E6_OPIVI|nr:hypothetical protein T265_09007 [Opisthorchis viverrini]KER23028.1 hypothetical protein T265_09007 [Opisthorchis viverrini]
MNPVESSKNYEQAIPRVKHGAALCNTFSCLETSPTSDPAGFQITASRFTPLNAIILVQDGVSIGNCKGRGHKLDDTVSDSPENTKLIMSIASDLGIGEKAVGMRFVVK